MSGDRPRFLRYGSRSRDTRTDATTNSFPSGHSASGLAFAAAVAGSLPGVAAPLRTIASAVGYSRVHTRVHYPGDAIVGSLIGTTVGESVALLVRRQARRHSSRSGRSPGSGSWRPHGLSRIITDLGCLPVLNKRFTIRRRKQTWRDVVEVRPATGPAPPADQVRPNDLTA